MGGVESSPPPRERIINELMPFAKFLARTYASQPTEADDFFQEIMVTFLEVADRYLVGWDQYVLIAKTAARNKVLDLIRKRKVRIRFHISLDDIGDIAGARDEEAARVHKDLIEQIARRVSDRGRQVMELVGHGLCSNEVAERLDVAPITVHRELKQLRMVAVGLDN